MPKQTTPTSRLRYKRQILNEKKRQYERLRAELPHRYGYKWYAWAWAFYNSRNRMDLLCAANQITKSSSLIRRHIERATNKELWKELWPDRNGVANIPRQFWYLYPSRDFATSEFQTKWVQEFMPRAGKYDFTRGKERCVHPVYGWEAIYDKKQIVAIQWASGLMTYFKTYSQDVHSLQGSSVHEIDCDEEMPEELYDEIKSRLRATQGYFAMVFTATRNQLMWLLAIEGKGAMEKFPDAFKQQITMYDCRFYMDGSPGRWHDEKEIELAKRECKSEAEVQRRIYGKFVADKGRKYPAFDVTQHFCEPFEIPKDYHFIGGIDYGTGGKQGHPSAMGIVAVAPDFKSGYVCEGWRGDGIETSSGDVLTKFFEVRGSRRLMMQVVDPNAKDLRMIADRMGESFIPAENSHEIGESVVNTLFKNGMLKIFDTEELQKLGTELLTVMHDVPKRRCKDDFIDGALRYPCAMIPWDWTAIRKEEMEKAAQAVAAPAVEHLTPEQKQMAREIDERRGEHGRKPRKTDGENWEELDAEIEFWNEHY